MQSHFALRQGNLPSSLWCNNDNDNSSFSILSRLEVAGHLGHRGLGGFAPERGHADQQLVHEVDEAVAVELGRDHRRVATAAQQPGALDQCLDLLVPSESADVVYDAQDLEHAIVIKY